ncbi:MAG: hypothetical protein JRI23_01545, partial [Deltaproteobacteria bacterium]|nr:hypothetical protein [Deltaproteobacteria bacterium]MBW2530150.1 hypothetical protein [Deltaproteobacteria bacterium]
MARPPGVAVDGQRYVSMRVDLFFPPFDYSVLIPELGVPLLTAVLRRAGHQVRQTDLNQEFLQGHLGRLESYLPLLKTRDGDGLGGAPLRHEGRQTLLED